MRLRTFLGMWAVLVCTVGVTVVVRDRLDLGGRADDQVVSAPDGAVTTSTTTIAPSAVPRPGQVRVEGVVTALHLDGAVLEPREVRTPLTIVSDRGFGKGGEVTRVVIDGGASTIVWDGGRPFALSGSGAIVLGPAVADLVPEGLRLGLGEAAIALMPGTYRLDTPVAVGSAGIATPHDSVVFDAGRDSLFEAHGDASIVLGPDGPRRLLGPGSIDITGELVLTDASGTRTTGALAVERAAFDLTLTPGAAGRWHIAGVVDEPAAP